DVRRVLVDICAHGNNPRQFCHFLHPRNRYHCHCQCSLPFSTCSNVSCPHKHPFPRHTQIPNTFQPPAHYSKSKQTNTHTHHSPPRYEQPSTTPQHTTKHTIIHHPPTGWSLFSPSSRNA